MVRQLSGMAVPQDDIAGFVEISDVTLRKHYSADLERGRAEANLQVTRSLYRAATRENNPNVVAQMFWLKNRAGWKDMGVLAPAADDVNTLAIEFVAPLDLAQAVRATQGPVINGTAEPSPRDEDENDADTQGIFEVPLPDEDPES